MVTQRLMKLETKGSPLHLPAEVIIRRRKRVRTATGASSDTWEMVRARGHLDEVEELKAAATTTSAPTQPPPLCHGAGLWRSTGLASSSQRCTCCRIGGWGRQGAPLAAGFSQRPQVILRSVRKCVTKHLDGFSHSCLSELWPTCAAVVLQVMGLLA